MHNFAEKWNFEHLTSSPGNSKANGKAESGVKTAKRLLRKSIKAGKDLYLPISSDYRNTLTQGMVSSPAQRLMSRITKTLLPTTQCLLLPKVTSPEDKKKNLRHRQQTQAKYYNSSAKDLPSRSEGDVVRMKPFKLSDKSWCKTFVASALISEIIHCWNARRCYIPQEQAAMHLKKTGEPASVQQDSSPSSPEESNQSRACEDLTHQQFQARAPATYQWRSSRHSQLVRQTTQSS